MHVAVKIKLVQVYIIATNYIMQLKADSEPGFDKDPGFRLKTQYIAAGLRLLLLVPSLTYSAYYLNEYCQSR